MSEPTGPISVSIEEMEAPKAPEALDLTKIKLEGDAIPELLRGKTLADVLTVVDGLSTSLKTSETARLQAEQLARLSSERVTVPVPKEPEPEPELTDEQLQELHEKDSLAAIRYMQDRAVRRVSQNVETRLGSLFTTTAAQVEQQMRVKYAAEFELFGGDITKVLAAVPNKAQVLSNPAAWEDVISMVRGRSGNFERLLEHKKEPEKAQKRVEAREIEAAGVGFTEQSAGRTRLPRSTDQMDDTMKEIARNLGFEPTQKGYGEYLRWAHVGNNG
jgi:hypothetical protein